MLTEEALQVSLDTCREFWSAVFPRLQRREVSYDEDGNCCGPEFGAVSVSCSKKEKAPTLKRGENILYSSQVIAKRHQ